MTADEQQQRRQALLLGVGFEGGLVLLALLLGWLLNQPPLTTLRWTWEGLALGVAATLPMLAVFLVILWFPMGPFKAIVRFTDEVLRPFFQASTAADLALISVLAGFGEEMLYRAVCQGYLAHWLGPWWALAAASLIFGLFHAITFTYVVLATLLGAYLGGLWLATDNLLPAIVAHTLYDFILLVYLVHGRGHRVDAAISPE